MTAVQGQATSCGLLGAKSTVQQRTFLTYWTVTEGSDTKAYAGLPALKVRIGSGKGVISMPAGTTVKCSLGGSSVPIKVMASTYPMSDVTVTLNAFVKIKTTDTLKSEGISFDAAAKTQSVKFDRNTKEGYLGF